MSAKEGKEEETSALEGSYLLPGFARLLADPAVRTVMMCGCGGGFDFVHGQALYPELVRLGKRVVIATYTFGKNQRFRNATKYWDGTAAAGHSDACVVVNGQTELKEPRGYAPDVLTCRFLDTKYPQRAPHSCYTMYGRAFTISALLELYTKIAADEHVDAVLLVDGGSDSLMAGDEAGLGDPIEDAVSIGAVHELPGMRWKLLVSMGFGCDRFNDVSDAASLRAVAELTRAGGFRGCLSLEPTSEGFQHYKQLVEYINANQDFHSVIAASIVAAGDGWYGSEEIPPALKERVRENELYLWPLMAQLWAFDVAAVVARSILIPALRSAETTLECNKLLGSVIYGAREGQPAQDTPCRRPVENLPRLEDYSRMYPKETQHKKSEEKEDQKESSRCRNM